MPVQKKKTSKSKKRRRRHFWIQQLVQTNIPFKLQKFYLISYGEKKNNSF